MHLGFIPPSKSMESHLQTEEVPRSSAAATTVSLEAPPSSSAERGGGGAGGGGFPMHKSAFMHPSNLPPPPTQLMAAQRRPQQLLNIGATFPLKPAPPPATSALNPFTAIDAGHCANEARDKGVDNTLVVAIKDRKVRLSNSASDSLYAVCRRWVRNDIPRKDQHDPWDSVRPLPRPLSSGFAESNEERDTEDSKDDNIESEIFSELEGTTENISEHQLLQSHVKHAKKIRVRLRDERMQRIGRFKQRLALLLPPSMEQNKSESAGAI